MILLFIVFIILEDEKLLLNLTLNFINASDGIKFETLLLTSTDVITISEGWKFLEPLSNGFLSSLQIFTNLSIGLEESWG